MAIDTEDKRRIASSQGLIWILGPVPDGDISGYNDRRHIAGMYPYAIPVNLFEAGIAGIGLNGTAAGNRVTVAAGAANATYGFNDLSGGGSSNFLNFDFWFDPNTVTLNATTVYIFEVANDSGDDFVQVRLRYSGGYEVGVWAWGSGQTYEQVGSWQSITDAEHHIEVFVLKAAGTGSSSGQVEWTLDDTSIGGKSDCDPFDFLWDESRLGIVGADAADYTGVYYLDELTITFTQPAPPDTGPDPPVTELVIPEGGIRMLRLLRGDDPRYPRDFLNLGGLNGEIYMEQSGFSPGSGEYLQLWSGRSHRFDGEKLLAQSKDNSKFELKYGLEDSSKTELFQIQTEINRFFEDAAIYQTDFIGERIWVEYRWNDGLDVEAPLWGDFNHYMEVFFAEVPKWPDGLHTGALIANHIESVVARFVCDPYATGLRRKAMHGFGNVSLDRNGIASGRGTIQEFSNAGFMNPEDLGFGTNWKTDWLANTGLGVVRSQKPGFFRVGHSAANLINTTGVNKNFYQNVTLPSSFRHVLSFDVKKADGTAVTSSDVVLMVKGETATPNYVAIDDNWYTVYIEFFGVQSAKPYGIKVKAGQAVFVDNAKLIENVVNDFPLPLIHPNLQVAGNNITHGYLEDADFGDILSSNFTLTAWLTPYFTSPFTVTIDYSLFWYLIVGGDYFHVTINAQSEIITVDKKVSGINFTQDYATSFTYNTPFHLVITQDNDTVSVYIDNTLLGTLSAPGYMQSNGVMWTGKEGANCSFDGVRIFGETFTNAQVTLLYTAESAMKADGKIIGVPPVLYIPSAQESAAVTQETNGIYLIGIEGDAAAKVDWELTTTLAVINANHEIWLGSHALIDPVLPEDVYVADFSGAVLTSAYGGQYLTQVIVTVAIYHNEIFTPKIMRGKFHMLAVARWLHATTATIEAFYTHGLSALPNYRFGEAFDMPQSTAMILHDLGVINFNFPAAANTPNRLRPGVRITNNGVSASAYFDFWKLFPAGNSAKIISGTTNDDIALGTGDTLLINGAEAALYSSTNDIKQLLSNDLGEVVAYPGKYNLVMFLMADDAHLFVEDPITITPYVTTRRKLAGGPIA